MKKLRILAVIASLAGALSLVVGVNTGCSSSKYHRSTGTYFDDKAISTKVNTELLTDPTIKSMQVKVKTYQGTVQLSGFVDTSAQKQRAAEIARRVQGVQMVKNDLIVKNVGGEAAGSQSTVTNPPQGTVPAPPSPQQPAPVTTPPQGTPPAPSSTDPNLDSEY